MSELRLKEVRCRTKKCTNLLFKGSFVGEIEYRCRKCGKIHLIKH